MKHEEETSILIAELLSSNQNDFNQIYNVEEKVGLHNRENSAIRVKWVNHLHAAVSRRCPKNKFGRTIVSDVDKMFATYEERLEALVKTFNNEKIK